MITLFDIFANKKLETPQDICKAFLKNVIVNETSIGTKKFRKNLYKNLLNYGIWNNYAFCLELNKNEFLVKSGYRSKRTLNRYLKFKRK